MLPQHLVDEILEGGREDFFVAVPFISENVIGERRAIPKQGRTSGFDCFGIGPIGAENNPVLFERGLLEGGYRWCGFPRRRPR